DTCTGVYTLREWVCSDLDSSVCTSTTVDCSKIPDAKGLICMNGICTQNLCSKCGEGLFNICDKEECSSLGQHCTYTAGIFGGTCIYRM
ncbi:hypothetical protein JW930_06205, partial [Candidatus Woesearchaeota archaeon]|nr:hypothetical protein [Candidatus Woesearchaeota archaeon]